MNSIELRMVEKLKELKEKHGALSLKAEFEAEVTKLEELLRLKEICMRSGIGLTLKIGGCESIRDMLEARVVGVNNLVAPMVESPYALRKYLQAVTKVFPADERKDLETLSNVETMTAARKIDEMLAVPEVSELDGIVIERIDLCHSMGLSDLDINSKQVNDLILQVAAKTQSKGIFCTVGGGVSAESLPFFKTIVSKGLSRYETRMVCFDAAKALSSSPEKGILKALGIELLWLRNKNSFYRNIKLKEQMRMDLIEHRYWYEIDSQF